MNILPDQMAKSRLDRWMYLDRLHAPLVRQRNVLRARQLQDVVQALKGISVPVQAVRTRVYCPGYTVQDCPELHLPRTAHMLLLLHNPNSIEKRHHARVS